MIVPLHWLRPWWILAIIPLIGLSLLFLKKNTFLNPWNEICDAHLLNHLMHNKKIKKPYTLLWLFLAALMMIFSAMGPAWKKLPAARYKPMLARVVLLDLSSAMMMTDLTPNRLARAKFKLDDLLAAYKGAGQFGLIAYTGEPFVVSPLTDDGQTIASLLPILKPDIMPIDGHNLSEALKEAQRLIKAAGYQKGDILIFTASAPSIKDIELAKQLGKEGIFSSLMPMVAHHTMNPLFLQFTQAGQGKLITYTSDSKDLEHWLNINKRHDFLALSSEDSIPLWRDEGRWLLIPALVFLLPLFQRDWLKGVRS